MSNRKSYVFFISFFAFQIWLLLISCKREYSCEGCFSTPGSDSVSAAPPPTREFPTCSLCKPTDDLLLSRWSFKTGNSFLCGVVNNAGAGIDPEKKAFTFFGPSACSEDTGLVMTIYLPVVLDRDRFDITTSKSAFFYYDNNAPKDIFISQSSAPFSVTVDSYIYSTGITSGTFSGTVYKANGDKTFITDGKFKVKLR